MTKATIEVRSLARQHTEAAISTLVEVMNNPKAQSRSRVSAAMALLDRGWGKPKETHEHGVTSELAELLKAIDGQTRGLPTVPPGVYRNGSNGQVQH